MAVRLVFYMLLFCCLPGHLHAQEKEQEIKYEREQRIKEDKVPRPAYVWIRYCVPSEELKAPKWYYEEGLETYSYECKFRLGHRRYSVKFDSTGHLEDVELSVRFRDLPDSLQSPVRNYLTEQYAACKIERVQWQYTGDASCLCMLFRKREITADACADVAVEMEVRLRTHEGKELRKELLFDLRGNLLKQRKIVEHKTENMIY
jgi:hypothetical protein